MFIYKLFLLTTVIAVIMPTCYCRYFSMSYVLLGNKEVEKTKYLRTISVRKTG